MEQFGDYIRKLRLEKRISQVVLASLSNCDPPYLSKIENGKETPSEELLVRLAKALDQDPYLMITKAGKVPSDFKEIILCDEQAFNYLHRKALKNRR